MSLKNKAKDVFLFGLNFLRNPIRNASLVPSSSSASRAMVKGIDFSKVNTVVELGPGTGVFTEEIIKRSRPETKIVLVEIEDSYVKSLRQKFGDRIIVENSSAHLFEKILEKYGIGKVDLIVSGLPFLINKDEKELYDAIDKHTRLGASFRFFTYAPPFMKKAHQKSKARKISFVAKNFPPLWIYGIN